MSSALRLSRPLALAALVALTAACATTASKVEPVPPTTMRGMYVYGGGAHALHPCGNGAAVAVAGDEDMLEPLRTRASARSTALGVPGQGVYAEITGTLDAGPGGPLNATQAQLLADHLPPTCMTSAH
ncbi:hypothetical protein FKV24_010525 [Lysobacter maris]|uniref:Uncharacterized protein n=1 Tax=Marilutibacter maris TaxID=1605891 RepID=A0A508AWM4_9GAMM|nr:hypothetical protein [Lysobacter maris]KAB8185775.1 hypothetical protein FKV24_010525 [Lysobacter maris]